MGNYIPHKTMNVITYSYLNLNLIYVDEKAHDKGNGG